MSTLADLSVPGQQALILEVEGDDAIAVRLMEMGLIDGEQVSLIGFAPFGDPIEFLVRGYRLSLRSSEARRIQVELLPHSTASVPANKS
ncbi:FeoA family protein [Planctomicrobium sp. SH664]|uniref:FeoA family protein n=1 Tax=Planctomicrobium sp. SH664 TaxID=3448125 RepID=UPI003F5AE863